MLYNEFKLAMTSYNFMKAYPTNAVVKKLAEYDF